MSDGIVGTVDGDVVGLAVDCRCLPAVQPDISMRIP